MPKVNSRLPELHRALSVQVCTACDVEKGIEQFDHRPDTKLGRRRQCRACLLTVRNQYKATPKSRASSASYKAREKAALLAYQKAYYQRNKDRISKRTTEYGRNNPEMRKAAAARWRKRHPEYAAARRTEPLQVIISRCRDSLRNALRAHRNGKKWTSVISLFGCSPQQLTVWIESNFLPGMCWGNRNEWDIDHIVPVSAFDLSLETDHLKCWHYSNLRPMWAKENRSKGAKILPFKPVQMDNFLGIKTA